MGRRTIIWHIGQSRWRGIVTAIWHEVGRVRYRSELYNGIDGALSLRYKEEMVNTKFSENWVSEILNRGLGQGEGLSFVDTGIVGEYELREWLKAGQYRERVFNKEPALQNIILQWDKDADIKEIRRWYKGHLGIFNETGFQEKMYYDEMNNIIELWEKGRDTWRELKRQFGNIKRCQLQFYEEYIFGSLARMIE